MIHFKTATAKKNVGGAAYLASPAALDRVSIKTHQGILYFPTLQSLNIEVHFAHCSSASPLPMPLMHHPAYVWKLSKMDDG